MTQIIRIVLVGFLTDYLANLIAPLHPPQGRYRYLTSPLLISSGKK
jgi:hypothetical protein